MVVKKPIFAKDRIVLALDCDTIEEAERYVIMLKDYVGYFKVGIQLAVACGIFETVEMIKKHGAKVFFDAKFNDIPYTTAKASANLLRRGVDFFNLSAIGGSKMMLTTVKLTREVAKKLGVPKPTILAVTTLSSFGQRTLSEELNIKSNIEEYGIHLAKLAKELNLDAIHDTVHEMAKDEARHGRAFEGLLARYFSK